MRAFCCGVLLQAADAPETRELLSSENNTLIVLVESALCLGKDASDSTRRFLAWRVQRMPTDFEERPFFAMALLLLQAALFEPDQDATDLNLLCEWVTAEESKARAVQGEWCENEEWLLGLTNFDQRHEVWRRVAQEVLLNPAKSFPEPAATKMRDIARRLSGEPACL
jgi:hypothetical protein